MKRNYFLAAGLLTLLAAIGSLIFYPELPAVVPTHWNSHGQVNAYGPRWEALMLIPAVMLGLLLLMTALPWLSPRRYEVDAKSPAYLQIMLVISAFLAYFHFVWLSAAAGRHLDIGKAVLGGICALFAAIGPLLGRLPRNFYVGIRTPWTLANEQVWKDSHRFGAKCFTAAGLLGLLLSFASSAIWAPFAVLAAGALAPVIYSLVLYKQLEHRGMA